MDGLADPASEYGLDDEALRVFAEPPISLKRKRTEPFTWKQVSGQKALIGTAIVAAIGSILVWLLIKYSSR